MRLASRAKNRSIRENNRDFSDFQLKMLEFCPNSAILLQKQGISREFPLFPLKPRKCKGLPINTKDAKI
jgi:hypothetical protein